MNQEESPNTDKAQERVTFFTRNLHYTIQVETERKGFHGEMPFVIPAKLIRFIGGNYSTDDEEIIKQIRNSKPYRRGKITEARKGEVLAEQRTHRGAITSGTIKREAGVEEIPQAMAIQERGVTRCDVPGCEATFENDFGGNKLRGHKLGAHRTSMRSKKIEEKAKK